MVKETSIQKELVFLVRISDEDLEHLLSTSVIEENLRLESIDSSTEINDQKPEGRIIAYIIGSEVEDPIQSAQRLHAFEKDAVIIMLAKSENVESLKQAIKFSPFIGVDVFCLDKSNEVQLEEKLDEILKNSKQAAQYRDILADTNPQISLGASSRQSTFSQNFINQLMDIAPIGIAIVGRGGEILGWNIKAALIFDKNESQVLGTPLPELFDHPRDDKLDHYLNQSFEKSNIEQVESLSLERELQDTSKQVLSLTAAPFDYSEGTEKALILAVKDITKNSELLNRLKKEVTARDNFLGMASHELRTPLTAMKINLELLNNAIKHNFPNASSFLDLNEKSIKQADHLNELIEDLFDVTKIHTGKLDFKLEEFNLSEFIENHLTAMKDMFDEADCELKLDIEPGVIGVWDKDRIGQAFSNLITNALKYASNSPVKVILKTEGNCASLSVKDEGPGIEEDSQEKIFERFERGDAPETIAGLGLGLFITKKIIESHSGNIEVQSSPGTGSVFTLNLPLDLDPGNPPEELGVLW